MKEPGVGLVELPLDNALLVLHARLGEPCRVHGHDGCIPPIARVGKKTGYYNAIPTTLYF